MPEPKRPPSGSLEKEKPTRPTGPITVAGLRWAALAVLLLALGGVYFFWPGVSAYFSGTGKAPPETTQAPSVEERLQALEKKVGQSGEQEARLEEHIAGIEKRLDKVQPPAGGETNTATQDRLDRLEEELEALLGVLAGEGLARPAASFEFASAVATLADPLFSSRPFEPELERVRALAVSLPAAEQGPVAAALETLSHRAAQGLPSIAALHQEFDAAALEAIKAGSAGEDAGWWDRVWAKIKGLVVIRRLDGADDSPVEVVLREVEAHLAAGRLDEAVELVSALPPGQAAAFQSWLADARARLEGIAAYRRLAAAIPRIGSRAAPQ